MFCSICQYSLLKNTKGKVKAIIRSIIKNLTFSFLFINIILFIIYNHTFLRKNKQFQYLQIWASLPRYPFQYIKCSGISLIFITNLTNCLSCYFLDNVSFLFKLYLLIFIIFFTKFSKFWNHFFNIKFYVKKCPTYPNIVRFNIAVS